MAGRTQNEERRAVAQRQECRDWAFTAEPAAEEFGGEQEFEQEAEAGESNAGRSSDAQALQGNAPGCVQADGSGRSVTDPLAQVSGNCRTPDMPPNCHSRRFAFP